MESMLDLTDLQDEIENAEEPIIAEADTEQHLRIVSVRTGEAGEKNCPYFAPTFEVMDAPLIKEFNQFMWVPDKDKLTPKQYKRSLWEMQCFIKAFDVDISSPIDYNDDLPGLTGWAILGVRDSNEYGEQNTIKKYVTPK